MTAKELNIIDNNEYQQWLQQLCTEIDKQRLKAAMQLNAATLQHYWWLGNDIIRQQKEQGWGAKVIDQLSVDLQKRYGNDSGYSIRNLKYMKQFAEEYPDFPFVQVPLAQIQEMPILQARLAKFTIIFVTKLLKLVSSSSTSEAASRLPRRYCAQLILLPCLV